jgi:hypothetical protein
MPCPPHLPLLDLPNVIWGWVQIMKFLTVQLPPFSCHLIPLRYKYSAQNPVLKHPQSMPERPKSFTPVQNNWQNYGFVYFNLSLMQRNPTVCLYVCDQETPKREAKGPSWTISTCEWIF